MKKKVAIGLLDIFGVVIGCLVISFFLRQRPRIVPVDHEGLTRAARSIFDEKCAACHDPAEKAPFYARLPGGNLVLKDIREGLRHWAPTDRRFLGPDATDIRRAREPVPQGSLAKLSYVLEDSSMPPLKYRLAHWGTGLSESERKIFSQWIFSSRKAWLSGWGIASGASMTIQPLPDSVKTDPRKVALGEKLYNDKRLSTDNTISCATCHSLDKGGTDNLRYSVGVRNQKGGVNAPTTLNALFNLRQFWDGRAATLEEQAGGPPLNPVEMACADWGEIEEKLGRDEAFRKAFLDVYPEGISGETLCDAIAEYERTLITPNSRFDLFLKGRKDALSDREKTGYAIFLSHRCDQCHSGPAMGGGSFEYADLKGDYFAGRALTDGDQGLAAFSKDPADRARFKVPLLRNVALTAPYLHDGSKKTLAEAVASMLKFQVGVLPKSDHVKAIEEFLMTLTGELNGRPLEKKRS